MPQDSARGSGLRHAWIKTADGEYHDIDAVMSLEGELEIDDTDVEGDDAILAKFTSKPTKSITVGANALTPDVIAAITGRAVTAITVAGPPAVSGEEIGLGSVAETNPPFVEVGGYTVAKRKSDDAPITICRIFHRVQLRMTNPTQEKDSEFNYELEGVAYPATEDIEGTPLSYERTDTLRFTNEDVDTLIAGQA